jgi:hypothetical protein
MAFPLLFAMAARPPGSRRGKAKALGTRKVRLGQPPAQLQIQILDLCLGVRQILIDRRVNR